LLNLNLLEKRNHANLLLRKQHQKNLQRRSKIKPLTGLYFFNS